MVTCCGSPSTVGWQDTRIWTMRSGWRWACWATTWGICGGVWRWPSGWVYQIRDDMGGCVARL